MPGLLLALGLCCAGAPPPPAGALPVPPLPPASDLPVPPPLPPQWQAMQNSSPAPVPNRDMQGLGDDSTAAQTHVHMSLKMAPESGHPPGEGFVNGSAGQYDPDRRSPLSPGISLKVPLQ